MSAVQELQDKLFSFLNKKDSERRDYDNMPANEINKIILRRLDRQEDLAEKRHNELVGRINSLEIKVDTTNGRVLGLESREKNQEGRINDIERGTIRIEEAHLHNTEERAFTSSNRREWVQMVIKTFLPNGVTGLIAAGGLYVLIRIFG